MWTDKPIPTIWYDKIIPDSRMLANLPHFAQIAFEARCAQRSLPKFEALATHVTKKNRMAVAIAVQYVKEYAAGKKSFSRCGTDAESAGREFNLNAPPNVNSDDSLTYPTLAFLDARISAEVAVNATFAAATAANAAIDDAVPPMPYPCPDRIYRDEHVHLAVSYVSRSLGPYETKTASTDIYLIRMDFALINALAKKEKWTYQTPVPPKVFAPMLSNKGPRSNNL